MDKNSLFCSENIKNIILGLIVGTAGISILLIIFALIMSFGVLPINLSSIYSSISLSVGSILGGYITAKRAKKKGLILGLILGGILFLIFTLISLIATGSAPSLITLLKGIITVISGGVGGILGVNQTAKRNII